MTRVALRKVQAADQAQRLKVACGWPTRPSSRATKFSSTRSTRRRPAPWMTCSGPIVLQLPAPRSAVRSNPIPLPSAGARNPGHNDLLINLQLEIPGFFSRFRRVAEVVTQDASSLEALRRSGLYKERATSSKKHDL